jgi:thiol-disulfide isomerase/thioredoxin
VSWRQDSEIPTKLKYYYSFSIIEPFNQERKGDVESTLIFYIILHKPKMLRQKKQQPTPATQAYDPFNYPTNQKEYDQAIQSSPLTLVEIYAEWCGPCKIFKTILLPLVHKYLKFVRVNHNTDVTKYTNKGSLSTLKNTCQPTFLLLNQTGSLLHMQRGLVFSEIARVVHENIKSIEQKVEWNKKKQSNTSNSSSIEEKKGNGIDKQENTTWSSSGAPPNHRRSSMKVDKSELRRRNSMAASSMKNAFKSTANKKRNSILVMQQFQPAAQSHGTDSKSSFKSTMQGLNNLKSNDSDGT